MQIKSISLRNIRSYSHLELTFQSGSTLLSGDIGCGKTTILLSIEFALFGLMKGMLSGQSLLRHGCKEGSATLSFSIEKNNYCISRTLKKTSSGITQDYGYLEINGEKKEYTAVELKSRILSILGYPDELLTKSKSLIYRYTVYTPQEEMKKIIFDSEDERLEKLAKIFNVDKYKRVRENAENYARELRAEAKILQSLEQELLQIKEKTKRMEIELEDKSILLQKISNESAAEEKNMHLSEQKIKSLEEAASVLRTLKQELNILTVEKNNIIRMTNSMKSDIDISEKERVRLAQMLCEQSVPAENIRALDEITADLSKYRELKEKTEAQLIDAKSKLMLITKKVAECEEAKSKISALSFCPTCKQEVNDSHKQGIASAEDGKIKELAEKKNQAEDFRSRAQSNIEKISARITICEKEMLDAKTREQKTKMRVQQENMLKELDEKIIRLKDKLRLLDEDLKSNDSLQMKLSEKIRDSLISEKEVLDAASAFKQSKDKHLSLKMKEAAASSSIAETSKMMEANILDEQKKAEQINAVLKKKNLEHWLSSHFISLVDIIEKNVMSSIRNSFKEHFEEWFNMLMEDESITATIDERFTPVVTQNGYDTELENLSGGEKTSVALAYRLALNKVINTMMTNARTRDLLILDEPTDGFSSHQLDKVREVLYSLGCAQTIIVSHESKMESFVDHIIKLRKTEHESELMH